MGNREPPGQHSSQTCSILWRSGSEEQTRAHSTLCRQEAREKDRYVLLGTGQAGAAPALQDPVDAPLPDATSIALILLADFWVPAGVTFISPSPWPADNGL